MLSLDFCPLFIKKKRKKDFYQEKRGRRISKEMVPFCCNFSWLCLLCNRNGKKMKKISYLLLFFAIAVGACAGGNAQKNNENTQTDTVLQDVPIRTGADQLEAYLPLLKGKKVGLMGNQTSIV